MRLIIKVLVCLCLTSVTVSSQERIRKFMAGPVGSDQIRVVIALADPLQDGYRLQSMIIDMTPIKKRDEQPALIQVDLTSTIRSVSTGEKKQKILVLRWKKSGELELKCDGKWTKQDTVAAIDRIMEVTKAVVQDVPLDAKTPTDVNLSHDLEQKVSSILDALSTEEIPCLRDIH
jgi:hypothetical protein